MMQNEQKKRNLETAVDMAEAVFEVGEGVSELAGDVAGITAVTGAIAVAIRKLTRKK